MELPAYSLPLKKSQPSPIEPRSNLVERARQELLPTETGIEKLSEPDKELAEQLEIWPMLLELYDRENPPGLQRRDELRLKIDETILESYFDAASVQAEVLRELSLLQVIRQNVISRRDRGVDINNAANFIASGTLNTVGSVLGFSANTPPFPGNLGQMLSGVVSTGMSSYALKQAAGGTARSSGYPTVIAELFGRPVDKRTRYPESVWRFLHGRSVDQPDRSRAQELETLWIRRRQLEPHGSPREKEKLDLVCGVFLAKKAMTLSDLDDQISMISDISGMIARMTLHLRDLLRTIDSDLVESPVREPAPTPPPG